MSGVDSLKTYGVPVWQLLSVTVELTPGGGTCCIADQIKITQVLLPGIYGESGRVIAYFILHSTHRKDGFTTGKLLLESK